MKNVGGHKKNIVRSPASPRVAVLLGLLVFGLTAVAVYRWGQEHLYRAASPGLHTATAYVVRNVAPNSLGATNAMPSIRTPFSASHHDPQMAVETANAQANGYADECRLAWRRDMEKLIQESRQAVEKARAEYRDGIGRLDAFRGELRQAMEQAKARIAADLRKPSEPSMIENPERRDPERRLSELRRQREQLLVDRTPLHPAIHEIDVKIAEVEEQLEAIPRRISDPTPRPASDVGDALQAEERAMEHIAASNRQMLDALTALATKAEENCRAAEESLEDLLRQSQEEPRWVVQYAEAASGELPASTGSRRLFWTATLASAMMACGIAFLSIGGNIETPVEDVEQLESDLGVPVFATFPTEGPSSDPEKIHRRVRMRSAILAAGIVLLASGPAAAFWGILWR